MTFHSACVRILRREARRSAEVDVLDLRRRRQPAAHGLVCRDLDLDPKRYPPRGFPRQVSNLKNELIDEETCAAVAKATQPRADAAQAYTRTSAGCGRPTRSTSTT